MDRPLRHGGHLRPGYKGLITLAKATGLVKDMQPKSVHAADTFEVDEADGRVVHKRFIPRMKDDDRGPLIAVYCRTTLPDGAVRFTVMDLVDIERIRAKSRAQNGPWKSDFEAMALKSVVKMDFKTLGVPPSDTFKALRLAWLPIRRRRAGRWIQSFGRRTSARGRAPR